MSAQSSTATETTVSPTLLLRRDGARLEPSPSTPGFPMTEDIQASPFYHEQSGPTRTMMPTFSNLEEERIYRKQHLALVLRILHRFSLAEGVAGHCSVRDPVEPDTFWVNPQGKSFARMRASDLVRLRVTDGERVEGRAPSDMSASSIHSQIYRIRGREGPSACEAIVHVHGPNTKAFSSLGRTLDMISQDACVYHDDQVLVPFGGAVFDNNEGERIATLAGPKRIAILQNHGIIAIGRLSIDEAAWW